MHRHSGMFVAGIQRLRVQTGHMGNALNRMHGSHYVGISKLFAFAFFDKAYTNISAIY